MTRCIMFNLSQSSLRFQQELKVFYLIRSFSSPGTMTLEQKSVLVSSVVKTHLLNQPKRGRSPRGRSLQADPGGELRRSRRQPALPDEYE